MKLDYFDMLSGVPIYIPGIGHIKSPILRDICPDKAGIKTYILYINFLSWDKDELINFDKMMHFGGSGLLFKDELSMFDIVTLVPETRDLCSKMLSFFMSEKIVWDRTTRSYICFDDSDPSVRIGCIAADNFDYLRECILKLNYIGLDKDNNEPPMYSSEKAKELWDRAEKYLAEQAKKSADKPEYHLCNVISKLCACHPSYNLLNVYRLTIFQLYDAFFQLGFLRASDLNERIFSTHGGESFAFEEWLKPILKNI